MNNSETYLASQGGVVPKNAPVGWVRLEGGGMTDHSSNPEEKVR